MNTENSPELQESVSAPDDDETEIEAGSRNPNLNWPAAVRGYRRASAA